MKIKLTIQEIVNDFYSLAQEEGFISGLAEAQYCDEKNIVSYHQYMKDMINKYLPTWEKHIDDMYWKEETTEEEKGLMISTMLCENFKKIFYQLV